MPKRTPLHNWHVTHGARMVDFAGWDMPVQYTGIVDEHLCVRSGVGLFDISHMGRLSFGGPDALALIQKVWTNDAASMKDQQARYGLVCNESGGIRDDVLVYRWSYGYTMVVNASNREKIIDWLKVHKASLNVDIRDQTFETSMVAVQGPQALAVMKDLVETDVAALAYYHATATRFRSHNCVVSRTGYTGEDGFEIMLGGAHAVTLWDELTSRGAKPCGLGARDTLRLEAAMPLYGHELGESIDPLQAGLAWAVKWEKGHFLGRDALLRLKQDSNRPRRIGLEIEGKRIAREEAVVLAGGNAIGKVTSGTYSPTLNRAIAMAYVSPAFAQPGTQCEVDVRGKSASARVVPLPFYSRPKK